MFDETKSGYVMVPHASILRGRTLWSNVINNKSSSALNSALSLSIDYVKVTICLIVWYYPRKDIPVS